jgi:hypothetical protein
MLRVPERATNITNVVNHLTPMETIYAPFEMFNAGKLEDFIGNRTGQESWIFQWESSAKN